MSGTPAPRCSARELPPLSIVRSQVPWLYDEQGRRYFDAISSWWVNLFGHADPRVGHFRQRGMIWAFDVREPLAGARFAERFHLAGRARAADPPD